MFAKESEAERLTSVFWEVPRLFQSAPKASIESVEIVSSFLRGLLCLMLKGAVFVAIPIHGTSQLQSAPN